MPADDATAKRLKTLINRGIPFSPARKRGYSLTYAEGSAASAWVSSVVPFVAWIDPTRRGHYELKCRNLSAKFAALQMDVGRPRSSRVECVGEMVSVLQELLADIESRRFT